MAFRWVFDDWLVVLGCSLGTSAVWDLQGLWFLLQGLVVACGIVLDLWSLLVANT